MKAGHVWGALTMAALLGACGGGGGTPTPTPQPGTGYTFTVSPGVVPGTPSIPMPDGSGTRPVAAVVGKSGVKTEFVLNEVLLSSNDDAAVQALVKKYNGTVVHKIVPPAKLKGLKTFYDLKLDLSGVSAGNIASDWVKDKPAGKGGAFSVSSADVLKLLRVVYTERQAGWKLDLNYVPKSTSYFDGSTESGSQDALAWPDFEDGGTLDIGIERAWQMLEQAGKLDSKVLVAVIDRGFNWNNAPDFPDIAWFDTRLPRANPSEPTKPWHGNMVSLTLGGRADNGGGAAGTGAPIVQLMPLEQNSIGEIIGAFKAGSEKNAWIYNMSFGGTADNGFWGYPGQLEHFEDWTNAMWNADYLLFASAGNDGANIDGTDDGDETVWYWPCENESVICVGGLEWGKTTRDSGSNYGTGAGNSVDLWAPYTTRIGAYQAGQANSIYTVNGTSFSSPFVAGVAALVWSANGSLSNAQVWGLLQKYAHKENGLPRVNAAGPVKEALALAGVNAPPRVKITNPASGVKISQGAFNFATELKAFTWDVENGCCAVKWTSSLDGPLGTGQTLNYVFAGKTPGTRTVTATATDAGGKTASHSITVSVVNTAPAIKITSPVSGSSFVRGLGVNLQAVPTDDLGIDQDNCTWTSSKAGEGPWTGCQTNVKFTTSGSRTLAVKYKDTQGATSNTASTSISITDPPPSGPPVVSMSLYKRTDNTQPNAIVEWSIVDPGGPGMADISKYTRTWELSFSGSAPKPIAPKAFAGRLGQQLIIPTEVFTIPSCLKSGGLKPAVVYLSVTDPEGLTTKSSVKYDIYIYDCIY